MDIYTQFIYEKKWSKITHKEAHEIIEDEMPQTDAEGIMSYILAEIKNGKTVTLGECRFKTILK